jgi:hypothetical protein
VVQSGKLLGKDFERKVQTDEALSEALIELTAMRLLLRRLTRCTCNGHGALV